MRILFVSNYYPPLGLGGYELWCQEVAETLDGRGHTVTVLVARYHHCSLDESQSGVQVRRLLHLEAEPGYWATARRFFLDRSQHAKENIETVKQVIAVFQPDVALLWGMWNVPRNVPALIEELLPDRVAYYLCDYWLTLPSAFTQYWQTPSGRRITYWPKKLVTKIAMLRLARETLPYLELKHPICVSRGLRDQLTRVGLPLHDAAIIYGGIVVEQFATTPIGQDTIKPFLRLLYVGRVIPDKGVHTVLAALGMLPEHYRNYLRFDIIGAAGSAYRSYLEHEAERLELGRQVSFLDGASRTNMPKIMSQYDALVFPSVWHEPFARTPLEAMAAGLVVIGTTTGGTGEVLVHNETGLTFAAGDPQTLADQIRHLIEHQDLCKRLAAQGQKAVRERFTLQRMADEIEIYLANMVGQVSS